MCGICGILYFDRDRHVSSAVLDDMNARISHRGPDDAGSHLDANAAIAMRRLSIIDLKTGHQPISNEDGTVWIVFNGEIYNHVECRERMQALGHVYRTRSDTESVIHLYEQYGADCVQHLRGMFAFAIWDARQRTLFLARDRFGIKPMYYVQTANGLVFGSEIKALLAHPGVRPELNASAVPEYLAFGYVTGEETLFSGLRVLPPGHTMTVGEDGSVQVRRYWDLSANPATGKSSADYTKDYLDLLREAVRGHMLADVPLGVFLSGGIDSSAIAALTAEAASGPLNTFSVGYSELPFSELPYAREVAAHIGTTHHEVLVSEQEFFDSLPAMTYYQDEPLAWPSNVALFFVAQVSRNHVKVVLTGEGSDETLAGYTRYAFTLGNSKFDKAYRAMTPRAIRAMVRNSIAESRLLGSTLRRKLQHTALGRDGEDFSSYYLDNFISALSESEQRDLLSPEVSVSRDTVYGRASEVWNRSRGDLLQRLLYTDINTYLVALLMKQDRMSMGASIESRVPFLDHVLAEYAFGIPAQANISGLAGKYVLKNAMRGILPDSILFRKKLGFPTPWAHWLRGARLESVREALTTARAMDRGLFRKDAINVIFDQHRRGSHDHATRIWRLFNFELWCRVFLDGETPSLEQYAGAGTRQVVA